jgi:hypothetical protein
LLWLQPDPAAAANIQIRMTDTTQPCSPSKTFVGRGSQLRGPHPDRRGSKQGELSPPGYRDQTVRLFAASTAWLGGASVSIEAANCAAENSAPARSNSSNDCFMSASAFTASTIGKSSTLSRWLLALNATPLHQQSFGYRHSIRLTDPISFSLASPTHVIFNAFNACASDDDSPVSGGNRYRPTTHFAAQGMPDRSEMDI